MEKVMEINNRTHKEKMNDAIKILLKQGRINNKERAHAKFILGEKNIIRIAELIWVKREKDGT